MFDWLPPIWNGTLREHYLLLFGAAGAVAMATGLVSSWLGAYLGARSAGKRAVAEARRAAAAGMLPAGADAQLAQLRDAVEAVAVEVERIAEAQRFTARVLSERPQTSMPPARREPGQITPH
jgi:hypothetical protein